ncbi:hypothetical protein MIR68_004175 [Amoeboaphelidium protococcarum]|nr:hypothetical protein MIR68_004175 [Amoeboaphelidium protococcarum]
MSYRPKQKINLDASAISSGTANQQSTSQQSKAKKQRKELNPNVRGNYTQYYGFRLPYQQHKIHSGDVYEASSCDERLRYLPKECIQNMKVLDVGCNTGYLTHVIARSMSPACIMGIDIDPDLIKRAQWDLLNKSSQMKPSRIRVTSDQSNLLDQVDVLRDSSDLDKDAMVTGTGDHLNYFPLSMPILFGPIPIVQDQVHQIADDQVVQMDTDLQQSPSQYPNNIYFEAWDILAPAVKKSNSQLFTHAPYDTVLAMSVTKWIHLYGGDADIRRFFKTIYNMISPGGVFIIEPQGWSSYKKYFSHSRYTEQDLHLRPWKEDADEYQLPTFWDILINEVGFKQGKVIKAANPQGKAFEKRPIWMFRK